MFDRFFTGNLKHPALFGISYCKTRTLQREYKRLAERFESSVTRFICFFQMTHDIERDAVIVRYRENFCTQRRRNISLVDDGNGIPPDDEIPPFYVEDGDVMEAQLRAVRYLVYTYQLHEVQGVHFSLRYRDPLTLPKKVDPREESIRAYAQQLSNEAFVPTVFQPRIAEGQPFLVESMFDKTVVGPYYRKYMQHHPDWKWMEFDDDRDKLGFEATGAELLPLEDRVYLDADTGEEVRIRPSLASRITHNYRKWHHEKGVLDRRKCTPAYYFHHAFLTGQRPEGIKEVLRLFDRPIAHPVVHTEWAICAYINMLRVLGAECSKEVPPIEPPAYVRQDLTRSGGINLYKTGHMELGNMVVRWVLQTSKERCQVAGDLEFRCIVDQIRKEFKDLNAGRHYVGQILRKIITAMFPKPEIGDPWRDPIKARLIFVVPYFKFAIDTVLFSGVLEGTYGVPPIGIGWSKSRGGMQFLYEHLNHYRFRDARQHDPQWSWFVADGDFKKLDFTMAPGILTLIGMLPLWFYSTHSEEYPVLRFLMEWSTDDLVSKFLHLFEGEDRLVIGMMFSGSLLTSWGDTCYVWFGFEMWYLHVAQSLQEANKLAELAHWKSIWPLPLLLYGDDLLAAMPSYVYPYWVGKKWEERKPGDKPVALSQFLNKYLNVNLKMEESDVYDSLLTVPGQMGRLSVRGPKFLQRMFVWARADYQISENVPGYYPQCFIPYRATTDYYTRASMTVNGVTLSHYVLKLRGLAVDTAGTNYEAYSFLRFLHDSICKDFPHIFSEIDALAKGFDSRALPYELQDVNKRLKPNDFAITELLAGFPSWNRLRDHFWPTSANVAVAHARARSTGFYAADWSYYDVLYGHIVH